MPDASFPFLSEFFSKDLPFTPRASDIELFESDLKLVSPFLMKAALKEVAAGKAMSGRNLSEWRQAIFKIYNRKVAEHAQLFPVFHSFETAFRSTVAVDFEGHYRRRDWWHPNLSALRSGNPPASVTHINNVPLHRRVSFLIAKMLNSLVAANVSPSGFQNGYEFLEHCSLSHIGDLVSENWGLFGPKFQKPGKRISQNDFTAKFARVREARNNVYHHKSVAQMTGVVSAAEELLDRLDFSLRFVVAKVADAQPGALTFLIPIEPDRHHTW